MKMGETRAEAARGTLDGDLGGSRPLEKSLQQERSDTSEAFLTKAFLPSCRWERPRL